MDEEIGIKVTRLRRRLSVEAEDVKSPSTQSTPTKKRGGRLAAKPQLEFIDENATEIEKPKRTRKLTVRDAEPEEKVVTPSRRSTRIRSNTSIVSETPLETEDKGTPSRRVTRVKSNTSIVAETTQHVDSPRAKRAARRISQVGSDNEAPITPGRTTRRTRKDSTSSVDKQADPNVDKLGPQVKEVIIEESENNIKDSTSKETPTKDRNESPTTRRSPRLIEKTSKRSSIDLENKHDLGIGKESDGVKSDSADASVVSSFNTPKIDKSHKESNISLTSSNLIKQLNDEPKTGNTHLNKTTSALEESQSKSKRRRTKSWTTIALNSSNNDKFLSDTEVSRKIKTKDDTANESRSGENVLNTSNISVKKTEEQYDIKNNSLNSSTKSEKKKKKPNDISILDDETKAPIVNTTAEFNKSVTNGKKLSPQTDDPNFTEKFLFHTSPSGPVQSLVYIEDSDSNTGTAEKGNKPHELESGDQCVPVVEHELEDNAKDAKNNCSYEPMDIDETMPDNVSLTVFTDKNTSEIKSPSVKRNSLQNSSLVNIDTKNNSHRKSNISDFENDNENSTNKSKKKSITAANSCNDPTDVVITESKRKSINGAEEVKDNSSNPDCNNSLHTSKRKSSISNVANTDNEDSNSLNSSSCNDSANKSATMVQEKSTLMNSSINKKKSNRKSSLSHVSEDENETKTNRKTSSDANDIHKDNDDTMGSTVFKSIPNADVNINIKNESITNESFNKTKKQSIVAFNSETVNDELDSGLNNSNNDNDNSNLSSNKSKRKSSNTCDNNVSNNFNESKKGSTVSDLVNSSIDKSNNKSKRKSSIFKIDVEDSNDSVLNKSSNKSKRKSSIIDMESHIFEKSNYENKSTLVLSQIKDVSETCVTNELCELHESKDCNEQLLKSVNVPNVIQDKETNKKNLSLTYSTSTPLQQKPVKKLGMQINSSIITPNTTKIKNNSSLSVSKKNTSVHQDDASESSDAESEECSGDENEESSGEESVNKSKLIEDEADEASEDYESGDSRDEDSRDYEEQHEIIEKGETLDSEDEEFSDDSEYEKGSFVVDSDEEDDELLSGSGDDLAMSADELNISAKSKNKYNERKLKEQKKASREMFEARHKLNDSDNKANSNKKVNRQRLESSESESEIKVTKTKKYKRARIDSSQDITITQSDHDTSKFKQKKKTSRRLSDSVSEENATNEKEISIHGNNETDKEDPLSLHQIVKEEPKTPRKDLNISTVSTANIEIEAVDVENNISILKSNQTTDPLQTTSVNDSKDVSDESISENEEITQNYNSVLNDLNVKSGKVKSLDMSVNLDKKVKRKGKEPIIDQLNLTQTKNLKSKKLNSDLKRVEADKKIMEMVKKSINTQEEGSSDSIDMKLLFNDDSTDSEVKVSSEKDNMISLEEFIPLKRTVGKTNILEKTDSASEPATGLNISTELNVSKSKKAKHTTEETDDKMNEETQTFFIDTTGTHIDVDKSVDTSIRSSAQKKRKNRLSENVRSDDDSNDTPLEVSYQSDKNKSKQNLDKSQTVEKDILTSDVKTPVSAKKNKKNKKGSNNSQVIEHIDDVSNDAPLEVSYQSDKNKSKQNLDKSQTVEKDILTSDVKTPVSAKKNKKNKKGLNNSQVIEHIDDVSNDAPLEVSYQSDKNKSKQNLDKSQTVEKDILTSDVKTPVSAKKNKKNKKSLNNSQVIEHIDDDSNNALLEVSNQSYKNKDKSTQNLNKSQTGELEIVTTDVKTPVSAKKNKKSKKSLDISQISENTEINAQVEALNIPIENKKTQKEITIIEEFVAVKKTKVEEAKDVVTEENISKKRKRNPSTNESIEETTEIVNVKASEGPKLINESMKPKNQKKKRKVSHTINNETVEDKVPDAIFGNQEQGLTVSKTKKKSKAAALQNPVQNIDDFTKKSKKRKERDDDVGENVSKIIKQNSLDKVHVTRLPTNVLKQLDDNPRKNETVVNITSTTTFKVEETKKRRNKPSNYLEQSVYLNDSKEEQTKNKTVKAPKVLPFIPTASTSEYGFTTNFKVNVIPQETQFVAQSSDVFNFKEDYLQKNRIKKLGTFEKYKRHRSIKLSKF